LKVTFNEYRKLLQSLVKDFDEVIDLIMPQDIPFTRRIYIRTFFAMTEGQNFIRKQEALDYFFQSLDSKSFYSRFLRENGLKLKFSDKEIIKLHEKELLRLNDNLKFSLRMLARAVFSDVKLDFGSEGWQSFRKAVKIRDRITHPKLEQEFDISDEDMKIVHIAADWFYSSGISLQEKSLLYSWVQDQLNLSGG